MDDRELTEALSAARRGEESGFAALWRSLQPRLLRYLRVTVGDAADDVASETWLQAARDLSGFTGDATAFRVWLFRIARHRGIDERRRVSRRPEEPHGGPFDGGRPVRDAALDAIDRSELAWSLHVIASLPPDQAEVLMLRVVAGLDVGQTAAVLGKRAGAVRIAAMRGLRRLASHPEVLARRGAVAPPERELGSGRVSGPGRILEPDAGSREGV